MSEQFIGELGMNNDFSCVYGKTIRDIEQLPNKTTKYGALRVNFTDGSWMYVDGLNDGSGVVASCAFLKTE